MLSRLTRAAIFLAAALASASLPAAPPELERLLAGIASHGPRQVDYREERTSPLLASPIISHGVLVNQASGRLIKQVIQPYYSRLEIDGDRLSISDGMREQRLSLDRHPALRGFVAAFRATLSGDADSLREHFHIELEGDDPAWRMTLVPRDESLRELLDRVVLTGQGSRIDSIGTEQPGGERSVMRIDAG
ncbi:MAG: LolA-related protein [Burkholderiaceae bacterium]